MDDLWKKTDKELAKIEKKLEKIYQEAYKDLAEKWDQYMSQANSEVAPFEKAYQKAKESGDAAEIQKAGIALSEAKKKATVQNAYWQGMVNQVAERYEHINETALAYVNDKIPGIYAMNLNGTLQEIETEAGKVKMGVAFDLVDERTVRNLVKSDKSLFPQKKMDKAKDKAWNKKAINSQILQGILQGESIPKIAHRLQNVTDMNAAAATRNARTMCTAAENNGRLSGLKEAEEKGIVYEKQWMSTHDDRTRESHQELDGVSVPVDEEFPNGLMYPGDPDGEPEEVYNCRCSLIRKLVGFKRKDGSISEVGEIHQYNPDYFQAAEPEQAVQAEQGKKGEEESERYVVQGKDISGTWERRPDEFDFAIDDVINAQGFDGLPRMVDAEEFDRYVKEANGGKGFIAQRIYSAPDQETLDVYREQLYNGEWYVDCSGGSGYGKGMYCFADYNGNLSDEIQYGISSYSYGVDYSCIETFTLTKDIKIIDFDEIGKLKSEFYYSYIKDKVGDSEILKEYISVMNIDISNFSERVEREREIREKAEFETIRKYISEAALEYKKLPDDYGAKAALMGYDAIHAGEETVILNRTKVIFKRS